MKRIVNFLRDESGMETLEYAMIAGLIAAAAIVIYSTGWSGVLTTRLMDAVNVTPGP